MQLPFRYPRIYSLSTVGIIYHGDCDYLLHPYCTSFAGDSGVGKSIVADLLQLLFVGPGAFRSATRSQQPRTLSGLVVDGLAYAYANIEVTAGRYVGMGCYLESAGTSYPFLVYHGYQNETLVPFEGPLGFRDFLLEGQINPYKAWAERLRQHPNEIRAQVFGHNYRRYHEILYANNIMPLDVGSSDSLLNSYAKIIRSFARSGELEKGTIDYFDFLFGKEAETAIWEDYQKLLVEFEQDGREHMGHHTLIDEVKSKVTNFRRLLDLRRQSQEARQAYATALVQYWRLRLAEDERVLAELSHYNQQHHLAFFQLHNELLQRKVIEANQSQFTYEQAVKRRVELEEELPKFIEVIKQDRVAEEILSAKVSYLHGQYLDSLKVKQWLAGPFGPTPNDLLHAQQQQELRRVESRQLEAFVSYLAGKNLWEAFKTSGWASSPLSTDHDARLRDLHAHLAAAEQLQKYNDLNDEDSLARWALAQRKRLTREQESVLAHFSNLPKLRTRTAAAGERYLADPSVLLGLPLPLRPGGNDTGFWLDLRGVGEWVPLLPTKYCVFFDNDTDRIEALLSQRAVAAGQTAEELRRQLTTEQQVQAALRDYDAGSWQAVLLLYARREARTATTTSEADVLPHEAKLKEMLKCHVSHEEIQYNWATAKLSLSEMTTCREAHEAEAKKAEEEMKKCEEVLAIATWAQLTERVTQAATEQRQLKNELNQWLSDKQLSIDSYKKYIVAMVEGSLSEAENELLVAARATHDAERRTGIALIDAAQVTLRKSKDQLIAAELAFKKLTGHNLVEAMEGGAALAEPDETFVRTVELEYEKLFASLAALLGGNGTRLTPDEPAALIQQAVPAAFKTYLDQPDEALNNLLAYLEEIVAQSDQLAEHKLTRLSDLLSRIRVTVKNYHREIDELEGYFRRSESGIAGGFRAKLRVSAASDYPLEWLHHFQDVLNAKARGETGAFEALRQHDSLQKMMQLTYLDKGGKNQQVSVRELLNPKSYLRFTYHMEIEGQINHGSTGQTFMAAALLNVARLSLIGREGRAQKRRAGVRFMPIDEAAGLGSNYTNLLNLAAQQGYQIISLAIEPVVDSDPDTESKHRIYVLGAGQPKAKLNLVPMMLRGTKAEPLDEAAFYMPVADLFSQTNEED